MLGQKGIACRTDYLVNGKHDCFVFLTASKPDDREGRPLCARTTDGGKTWNFVGWIGPEPPGYAIMPSTVRVSADGLLSAIRLRDGDKSWIEAYFSPDEGQHWELRSTPAPDTGEGNPAAMLKLADGRMCITYGVRATPFGMRAQLQPRRRSHVGQGSHPARRRRRPRPGLSAQRAAARWQGRDGLLLQRRSRRRPATLSPRFGTRPRPKSERDLSSSRIGREPDDRRQRARSRCARC